MLVIGGDASYLPHAQPSFVVYHDVRCNYYLEG